MMHITFDLISGLPGQSEDTGGVSGEILTHNGIAYDLSEVVEGLPFTPEGDHPFVGAIERLGGVLHLRMRWQYDAATAESDQVAEEPAFTLSDRPIPDPVLRQTEDTE